MQCDEVINALIRKKNEASRHLLDDARCAAMEVAASMRLMLFGSNAVAEYVEDETDIKPDVDVLSCKGKNSKKTCHVMAHYLSADHGIDGLRVIQAIHKATQSIRQGRHVISDVTWIEPWEMNALKNAVREENLDTHRPAAPLSYLKMSMHEELCRPSVFIDRWDKVHRRLKSLYEAYPMVLTRPRKQANKHLSSAAASPNTDDHPLLKHIGDRFLITGRHAVKKLTGEDILHDWPLELIHRSTDTHDTLSSVNLLIHDGGLDYPAVLSKPSLFLPGYYILTRDGDYVGRVFDIPTDVCGNRCDDGFVYGSTDAVLELLYGQYLRSGRFSDHSSAQLVKAINAVADLQTTRDFRSGLTRRFLLPDESV